MRKCLEGIEETRKRGKLLRLKQTDLSNTGGGMMKIQHLGSKKDLDEKGVIEYKGRLGGKKRWSRELGYALRKQGEWNS